MTYAIGRRVGNLGLPFLYLHFWPRSTRAAGFASGSTATNTKMRCHEQSLSSLTIEKRCVQESEFLLYFPFYIYNILKCYNMNLRAVAFRFVFPS